MPSERDANERPDIDWNQVLRTTPPDRLSLGQWSPRLAYGRHFGPPRPDALRDASVAALFYPAPGDWNLALIRRPMSMLYHAGQIALPGGRIEPEETAEVAMWRELEEELAVGPADARCLGPLQPRYVFATSFLIQPWLLVADRRPDFVPSPDEVDELIEFPLERLLECRPQHRCRIHRWGTSWWAPCFAFEKWEVWGATSLVLAELQARLLAVLHPAPAADLRPRA